MYDFLTSPQVMPSDASRGVNPQGGKTYYVNDVIGNDNWEGSDPEFPLRTLAAAYAKCVDTRDDYIFVQRHTTTGTLTITKKNTHIIGLSNGLGLDEGGIVAINGVAAVAVDFSTGNEYVELAGFDIGGDGTTHAIDATDQSMFAHIHHCTIGNAWSAAVDGIHSTAPGGFNESTFDHLFFGMSLSGYGMNFSIYTAMIAHCLFKQNALGCIFLDPQWVNIFGNMFFIPAAVVPGVGWAVDLGVNSSNCLVMHNWAADCGDASASNPYRDRSAGLVGNLLNGWADNYDGPVLSAAPTCP
jgi:hypothetical protein